VRVSAGQVVGRVARSGGGIAAVLHESVEGVRIAAGSRLLSGTLVGAAIVMLGLGAVNVLFVPFLVDVLGVAPAWFGAVELAQASSMVASALLVAALFARARPTTIVVGGLTAVGVLIAITGMATEVWQLLVMMFLVGWAVAPVQVSLVTIIQTGTDDAVRGRVAALFATLTGIASVMSMAFAGIAGDRLGVRAVFLIAGGVSLVAAAVAAGLYRGVGAAGAHDRPRETVARDGEATLA